MKIIEEEIVTRYHVEYDAEETRLLKSIGFLPPYAKSPARLWSTKAEIEDTNEMIANAKKAAR